MTKEQPKTAANTDESSIIPWNNDEPGVSLEMGLDVVAFRQSDEGKKLLAWLKKNYSACKSARVVEENQWKLNLAMYNGMQDASFIKAGQFRGELMQKPRSRNTDKKTINRTETIVRTEMSKLTSQKPSASVLPASSDDQDMFAAMAGEQVWESQYRKGLAGTFVDVAFWTSITGNGFLKTYWDNTKLDSESGETGCIEYESVNPFCLFVPDLRQIEIEKQPYIINVYVKTPEWLRLAYERELEGIDLQPNVNAANEFLDETYLQLSGAQRPDPDGCVVVEYWIKPGATKALPDGGHVVYVDDTLLSLSTGQPYNHNEFPFAHVGHIHTGKFYRRSVLNSTNPLQKEYNEIRTQIDDTRKKMGKVQLVAQKGSIQATKMSNETGLVIEYRQGYERPSPLPLSEVPAYVQAQQNQVLLDIEDITGQHQVSKGNVPPGLTAATAISFLQEKDDSYLSVTVQSVEAAFEKVARQTLVLAVQMWDIPRLIKIVGEDNSFDTMFLAGADISRGTDIRIEGGSALPTSKAARQSFIMDLMDRGYIPPENGLEILSIGGAEKLMDQLQNDKRQAQRENIRIKSLDPMEIEQRNQQQLMEYLMQDPTIMQDPDKYQFIVDQMERVPAIPVNEWDNHQVHIETHNRYRRSQAFEFLDDKIKAEFEKHVNAHKDMMVQVQIDDMMRGIPSDGTAPGAYGIVPEGSPMAPGGPLDASGGASDMMNPQQSAEAAGSGPTETASVAPEPTEAVM